MHTRILWFKEAPSVFSELQGSLQDSGYHVEVAKNTPANWPLSGPEAAHLVLWDATDTIRGDSHTDPVSLAALEETGYIPVVIFGTRVCPAAGSRPDYPSEDPAVPTLLEQIRILLGFDRAVNRIPEETPDADEEDSGCSIRDLFHGHVKRVLDQTDRSRSPVSCVLVRLDGLEQLVSSDDAAARQTRDGIARLLLDRLREGIRISDFVCRYDANTFALLLDDTGMDGARQCVSRLREALETRTGIQAGTTEVGIVGQWEFCCFLRNDRERALAEDPPSSWRDPIRLERGLNVLDTDGGR